MAAPFVRSAFRAATATAAPRTPFVARQTAPIARRTFAPTSRRSLATAAEQPRLRLGSEAPNFQAKTTHGDIDFHNFLSNK
ncbi:hypothetical protein KC336_g21578, partial [Hortaea werneckii]